MVIQNIANWACIVGFVITLITLLTTLNIRGKIERSLGKQRFLQQRERIIFDFTALRTRIKGGGEADAEALEELRSLLLQMTHYRIWHLNERAYFKRFIAYLTKAYDGEKKAGAKGLVMRIDEVVAIVRAQTEV